VRVLFEREVDGLHELADADLIVASDGISSRLREQHRDRFGTEVRVGRNKYLWLGTRKVFDAFTFRFVETAAGWIWCHAYGFDPNTSTFIVECSPETWTGLGFDRQAEEETIAVLERLFEPWLEGHKLRGTSHANQGASWLNLRTLSNESWHHGKLVLMGDAAHTTHFTIGSGTKLALEDALGLVAKLREDTELETALERYASDRRRALAPAQSDARFSAQWFENVPRYARLEPERFFALLRARRSPLLPRVPPPVYYRLHRATRILGATQRRSLRAVATLPVSGPRSRGARAHPPPHQGWLALARRSVHSGLVLATQNLGGITGRGTRAGSEP
jgi:2-polyprenyl-6-methoxyphenol hydroxylase-like FAD-dependent oxidoreductase